MTNRSYEILVIAIGTDWYVPDGREIALCVTWDIMYEFNIYQGYTTDPD